ncbi:MAG: sodium/proline symporter [Mailhella sp.]|nr:sodium/proline symporter [Mailhella sp.]
MDTNQAFVYLAIIVYLAAILFIGFWFSKSNEDADDFYLGGRKLGPFVAAMSAEASDMSSWLLMGLPGLAYFCGIADPFWTAIGLGIGTYFNWLLVASRLRRYSARLKAITVPDFFSRRFHDDSRMLLGISALIIIIFFIPYVGSGFAATGKLFASLFGMDYLTAMLVGSVVIVSYTTLGGFLAASTTDLIQSIIMSLALLVVIGFGIEVAGGWDAVTKAADFDGYISLSSMTDISTGQVTGYGLLTIISTMAWGLGYFGMPHILLRFMAIDDERHIPLSRRIGTTWVFIAMGAAILIGIIGYGMSKAGAFDVFKTNAEAETLIIVVSHLLSQYGVVAAFIAGLVLAGILACTMSTADSQLLAAASGVSENIMKGVFGIKLADRTTLLIARLTDLGIAAVGIFIARDPASSIFKIVSFAWAGFGAAFGPVVLFALFWRRCNKYGAMAGMVTGGAMIFIWKFLLKPMGGVWGIYELLPGFLAASAAILIVSLITPAPSREITDEFDAVNEK